MLQMETIDHDILLRPLQAAEARGVSDQHQRRERCHGDGPPFLKCARTGSIWYPWSGLVQWCEEHNRRLRWPGEEQQ